MSLISKLFGTKKSEPTYQTDELTIRDHKLRLTFFAHASIAIEYEGRRIYVDPVMENADYERLPKADVILVTHSHYDHFDMAAIESLYTAETSIRLDKSSAVRFQGNCFPMLPGSKAEPCRAAQHSPESVLGFYLQCGWHSAGGRRVYRPVRVGA